MEERHIQHVAKYWSEVQSHILCSCDGDYFNSDISGIYYAGDAFKTLVIYQSYHNSEIITLSFQNFPKFIHTRTVSGQQDEQRVSHNTHWVLLKGPYNTLPKLDVLNIKKIFLQNLKSK